MQNYVQPGASLTLPASEDVTSGRGILIGSIFGIAQHDADSGDDVSILRHGVVTHAKTSAQAWAVGAKLYWDNTNKVFTTAASGNTLVGAAGAAAANPSDTGTVVLDGAVR